MLAIKCKHKSTCRMQMCGLQRGAKGESLILDICLRGRGSRGAGGDRRAIGARVFSRNPASRTHGLNGGLDGQPAALVRVNSELGFTRWCRPQLRSPIEARSCLRELR